LREVFPNNVKEDKEGYLSASYGSYDPIIIESIKALKSLIDDQKKLIDFQNDKINALEMAINILTSSNEIYSEKK
jgi:trimeric autotransporter adhesin